eukprot:15142336-Alexandrium_andersonii.AAC.1
MGSPSAPPRFPPGPLAAPPHGPCRRARAHAARLGAAPWLVHLQLHARAAAALQWRPPQRGVRAAAALCSGGRPRAP